jgi:hypothetical protein
MDPEIIKIAFTVLCSFSAALVTIGKWFHCSIDKLNERINSLSLVISGLDKNLAVQSALMEKLLFKGANNGRG